MKRLLKYDAIIGGASLVVWVGIVITEAKCGDLWYLRYVFGLSLFFLFLAFPVAGLIAFLDQPKARVIAAVVSFLLTPAFIGLGVVLVWYFKIAIGGRTS